MQKWNFLNIKISTNLAYDHDLLNKKFLKFKEIIFLTKLMISLLKEHYKLQIR